MLQLKLCHKIYKLTLQKFNEAPLVMSPRDQRYDSPLMLVPLLTILKEQNGSFKRFVLELNFSVDKQGITSLDASLFFCGVSDTGDAQPSNYTVRMPLNSHIVVLI